MVYAVEILKDKSQREYVSYDIDSYDEMPCLTDLTLPYLDLTQIVDWDIKHEIVSTEIEYEKTYTRSLYSRQAQGLPPGIASSTTYTPVEREHSVYYCWFRFKGERRRRNFTVDEEVINKIKYIEATREHYGEYECTPHPHLETEEERKEREIKERKERKFWIKYILAMIVVAFYCCLAYIY